MIISGYSYDKVGPYLIFCDITSGNYSSLRLENKDLNITKGSKRYCVGIYDLKSLLYITCPNKRLLDLNSKINNCKDCYYKMGFNPAFYNAKTISPQQLKYNNLDHCVYIAYFSNSHMKIGIASKKRVYLRLMEQGARAAYILKTFPDAYLARNLEANLCGNFGLLEKLSSNQKANIFCSTNYNSKEAFDCLTEMLKKINIVPESEFLNLNPIYFYNNTYEDLCCNNVSHVQNVDYLSGKSIGMVGDMIILKQNSNFFVVSIKGFISYEVEVIENKNFKPYQTENKQLSFW